MTLAEVERHYTEDFADIEGGVVPQTVQILRNLQEPCAWPFLLQFHPKQVTWVPSLDETVDYV